MKQQRAGAERIGGEDSGCNARVLSSAMPCFQPTTPWKIRAEPAIAGRTRSARQASATQLGFGKASLIFSIALAT